MKKSMLKNILKTAVGLLAITMLLAGCSGLAGTSFQKGTNMAEASARADNTGKNYLLKVKADSVADSDDRVQFKMKGVNIAQGSTIKFKIKPYSGVTAITVRDGAGSNTKWLADAALGSSSVKKLSGEWAGFYEVTATASNESSVLGFTITGKPSAGSYLYIDDLVIGKTTNNFSNYSSSLSNLERWYNPAALSFSIVSSSTYGVVQTVKVIEVKATSLASSNSRFQFYLDGVDIGKDAAISFKIKPNPEATSLTVRGVTAGKWLTDAAFGSSNVSKITSGDYKDWYQVTTSAKTADTQLAFTLPGAISVNRAVYLADINIGSTKVDSLNFVAWYEPAAVSASKINITDIAAGGNTTPPDSNTELMNRSPSSDITISKIEMINAGPGKNCSSEMTISWFSPRPGNYIEYTTGSDFTNAKRVYVEGIKTKTDKPWRDPNGKDVKFYICKAYLEGLSSSTEYKYRVGNKNEVSGTRKFKTAGTNGSFSFAWMADLHTPQSESSSSNLKFTPNIQGIIDRANRHTNIDFVMFSGDMVNVGNCYKHWQCWDTIPSLSNYMYALVPGNHDYYYATNGKDRDNKNRESGEWFIDYAAMPKTQTTTHQGKTYTVKGGNYWFIYNKVLFINIDSMVSESKSKATSDTTENQVEWFKGIFEEVNSKGYAFNFVVVQQHFAYLVKDDVKYGHYETWYPVFDEYKVDLALSADSHEYSRTYELKANKKASNGGTVYVTAYQTNGKNDDGEYDLDTPGSTYSGSKCAYFGGGGRSGCFITVNNSEMTFNLVGKDKDQIYDTVTIKKKSR